MNVSPSVCQIVMIATPSSARSGFSRIGGSGLIPSQGSSPTTGLNSVPKITDATATEVATVDEKIVR